MLNMRFVLKRLPGENMTQFIVRVLTGIVFGTAFWSIYLFMPAWVFTATLVAIALVITLFEWNKLYNPHMRYFWIFLPIYLVLPFVLLIYLNYVPEYRILLFYLFLLAFAHDTSAYITGSLFGYHKIWPTISPKKTWEGAAGGLLAVIISLLIVFAQRHVVWSWWALLLGSVLISIVFVSGDLIESRMKHKAGIKDSGHFLPGHGGFLDRFDGILFAAFFVFLFRNYLITLLV